MKIFKTQEIFPQHVDVLVCFTDAYHKQYSINKINNQYANLNPYR